MAYLFFRSSSCSVATECPTVRGQTKGNQGWMFFFHRVLSELRSVSGLRFLTTTKIGRFFQHLLSGLINNKKENNMDEGEICYLSWGVVKGDNFRVTTTHSIKTWIWFFFINEV